MNKFISIFVLLAISHVQAQGPGQGQDPNQGGQGKQGQPQRQGQGQQQGGQGQGRPHHRSNRPPGQKRMMPQEMIDEMTTDYFKFTDKNFEKVKVMISEGFKGTQTTTEKELKTLIKDMREASGLSAPGALVGQFVGPVNMNLGQFPGKVNELLGTFSEFYSKMNEQFTKLPPFKMQDPRAVGMKTQFKDKFLGYFNSLEQVVNQKADEYIRFVGGFKQQFEQILQQAGKGADMGPHMQELNNNYQQGVEDSKKSLTEALTTAKTDTFQE